MNIPARPSVIYQLVLHVPTGARYAVRIEEGEVTGCVGPRSVPEWRQTDLETLDYDAEPELAAWARQQWWRRQFDLT